MEKYDDFAVSLPEDFERMAKEYGNINGSEVLISSTELEKNLALIDRNFDYLQELILKLKKHTSNIDSMQILNEIALGLEEQKAKLEMLFGTRVYSQRTENPATAMFCNNLKLALQTCSGILSLLVRIKDDDRVLGEQKLKITDIINSIIEINNKLVSLFGECKYRNYGLK